jgi:membrane protein YqaA with SNARE-associated domain
MLFAALAFALGLTLGAVTKFGLGYDLPPEAASAKSVAKTSRLLHVRHRRREAAPAIR